MKQQHLINMIGKKSGKVIIVKSISLKHDQTGLPKSSLGNYHPLIPVGVSVLMLAEVVDGDIVSDVRTCVCVCVCVRGHARMHKHFFQTTNKAELTRMTGRHFKTFSNLHTTHYFALTHTWGSDVRCKAALAVMSRTMHAQTNSSK